eukprot:UN01271
MCSRPVCEMQGQCQNSHFNAVFPTMTALQVLTKEECVQFFQSCGDASSASYRASTHTCQIFGNGVLPTCAAVAGWQPGNAFDRGSGPVTTTTGNAAPWNGVTCFSENLCDSLVQLQMTIKGWTQAEFDVHRDEIIATIATTLGLSSSQVQVSLGRLGWLRRNLQQSLTIYVRVKAQNDQMPTVNSNLAQVPTELTTQFAPAQFEAVNTETKTVAEAQVTASICPTGTIERVGASFDGTWVTYTDTIEDCLTACDLQSPNHGQLPPRDCNAIMWSPTVRAGTKGQCWRFETAAPDLTTRHSDYTYCERVGAEGEIMDSGLECNPGNAITTENECRNMQLLWELRFLGSESCTLPEAATGITILGCLETKSPTSASTPTLPTTALAGAALVECAQSAMSKCLLPMGTGTVQLDQRRSALMIVGTQLKHSESITGGPVHPHPLDVGSMSIQ